MDGIGVGAWGNVLMHPILSRKPLVGDWVAEVSLRIKNHGRLVRAYGVQATQEVVSAILSRVHRAIGSSGVATPDGGGCIDVLLWDSEAFGGASEPGGAAAWLDRLALRLTLEPVITAYGPVHAIISASARKGTGSSAVLETGSGPFGVVDTDVDVCGDKVRAYRSDMSVISPVMRALDGSRQSGFSSRGVEIGVFWRPVAATGQSSARPMFEASLGLVDGNGQMVALEAVIEAAERLGVVHLIDRYLVSRVLTELQKVPESVLLLVSLSAQSLCTDEKLSEIIAVLERKPLAARRLVLEVRDTSDQKDWGRLAEIISNLRRVGSKISIGNFGTGFASLRHLFSLKPDFIAVDPRFLKAVGLLDSGDGALVHLIGLARSLGAKVIIDGVDGKDASVRADLLGASFQKGALIGSPRICRPWATGCSH